MRDSNIVIISGPSGAGKSSLCDKLFKHFDNIYFSISSTTRYIRDGEIDGVHYHFISHEEFINGINNNLFLEWAKVHNNYYGTQRKQVDDALNQGKIILFDVDIQGQKSIKKFYPNATSIFITTPNMAVLEHRLRNRALDSKESIDTRLSLAYDEMRSIGNFDFVIVNDDFDKSFNGFLSIVKSIYFKNTESFSKNLIDTWR